jgi:hypothetical protein
VRGRSLRRTPKDASSALCTPACIWAFLSSLGEKAIFSTLLVGPARRIRLGYRRDGPDGPRPELKCDADASLPCQRAIVLSSAPLCSGRIAVHGILWMRIPLFLLT